MEKGPERKCSLRVSRSQHIQIIIFLSATTLLDTELDTCIISPVKLLSPSRGTVGRVTEPTKKSRSYHLDSQWSAKQHWAEISILLAASGLLSRSRLEAGKTQLVGHLCAHCH